MNKKDFLSIKQVSDFIEWLTLLIDEPEKYSLNHKWRSVNSSACFNQGEEWSCSSLEDATFNYKWPAKKLDGNTVFNLLDTQAFLNELSDSLKASVVSGDGVLQRVNDILSWGGVKDKKNIARDIRFNLESDEQRALFLNAVKHKISKPDFDPMQDTSIEVEGRVINSIVSDSGTTKIFALFLDEFAIYDSRVGAALGMLLTNYMKAFGINEANLDKTLRFGWQDSPNKDYSRSPKPNNSRFNLSRAKQKRNPNTLLMKQIFPYLAGVSNSERLAMNIYLNWILQTVVRKSHKLKATPPSDAVRNLEAALFMIGYCVNPHFDDHYWHYVDNKECQL